LSTQGRKKQRWVVQTAKELTRNKQAKKRWALAYLKAGWVEKELGRFGSMGHGLDRLSIMGKV
jgi:hypothetical protein